MPLLVALLFIFIYIYIYIYIYLYIYLYIDLYIYIYIYYFINKLNLIRSYNMYNIIYDIFYNDARIYLGFMGDNVVEETQVVMVIGCIQDVLAPVLSLFNLADNEKVSINSVIRLHLLIVGTRCYGNNWPKSLLIKLFLIIGIS